MSYLKSNDKGEKAFFEDSLDTLNPKVVHAMKNFHALYNEAANEIRSKLLKDYYCYGSRKHQAYEV